MSLKSRPNTTKANKVDELSGVYDEFVEKVGVVEWAELIEYPAARRFSKWIV